MSRFTIRCDAQATDYSHLINQCISDCKSGDTICFQPGKYPIHQSISLFDKHNIALEGNGAEILTDVKQYLDENDPGCDAFHLENCSEIVIRGFTVRTEWRNNMGGTIVNSTPDYLDIRIDCPNEPGWSGSEYVTHLYCISQDRAILTDNIGSAYRKNWCTFGEEIPNSHASITNIPHETINNGIWRFFGVSRVPYGAGTRCWLNHFDRNTAFLFRDCSGITVEDVTIPDWNGMAFIILPYCRDFTFRRIIARPDQPDKYPGAVAADIIHTTGLGGKLIIEDCVLEGAGDDVTNIHTPALTVRSMEGKYAILFFDKEYPLFPKRWAKTGDVLTVYDSENLSVKGKVKILWVREEQIMVDHPELMRKGDFVINDKYRPDILIRNSEFYHARSRLCIQSAVRLEITGCTFRMESHKAQLYISTAFHYWGEAGGVDLADIHDNVFYTENCPGIWARLNESNFTDKAKIHGKLSIYRNKFIHCHGSIHDSSYHADPATVDISSVSEIVLTENSFDDSIESAVHLEHYDKKTVQHNQVRHQ